VNWKNVLLLVKVDVKSYRVIRGSRFRRFRENRLTLYGLYVGAVVLGVLAGLAVGNFYRGFSDSSLKSLFFQGATSLFISLPTLALLYGLVISQMNQIQRMGAKISIQPLYWFPITWKEQTLASIMAGIIGMPLVITLFISSAILLASIFFGLVPLAVLTILALTASLLLGSTTAEILKSLQVRMLGAVTKAAGRAAIWVRLIGSLVFFVVFYIIYFSIIYSVSPAALAESIASGQRTLWFIPYVWLGVALFEFADNQFLLTAMLSVASLLFIYVLFVAAAQLNARFGLYEPPSVRISYGAYAPKRGFLGRLGFSSFEAAMMRKDVKAFTRRRELTYIFILPVIVIIAPLLTMLRGGTTGTQIPATFQSFWFVYLALLPGALMAVILGSFIVGSEGESVRYLYSLPVSAKSLVKAKYFFVELLSLVTAFICSIAAVVITMPSIQIAFIGLIETVLIVSSLSMVSLTIGIKGADFRELPPRPRMIRPFWSIVDMIVCAIFGFVIIAPLIPYGLQVIFQAGVPSSQIFLSLPQEYPFLGLLVSGVIAFIIAYGFHKVAVNNAEQLLLKAEGPEG
jgi:hypothetical protein